jgi:hypothetical protein
MTRVLKILTVAAAMVALCGVILSAAYTQTVDEEVTRLRRENRSDIVYLRTRVRELESMLTAELAGRLDPPDLPVDGVPEDTIETAATDEAETDSDTESSAEDSTAEGDVPEDGTAADEPDTLLPESEEVTVPTHNSPETAAPTALYTLAAYNGMIGVFDQGGELVRVINVFVMTLPQAEQEALAMGIPAYSEEEMRQIAERFE